ncbi:MAG: carbohydrate-binding domain-containing protein [Oscillospiraceae bacterium]|nr:carbohydrate-binding domain-containing protein [Oscillospiraceae bacterium]
MKRTLAIIFAFALLLSGCSGTGNIQNNENVTPIPGTSGDESSNIIIAAPDTAGAVAIVLSDDGITVDGEPISNDDTQAVYTANDIVFYLEGQGIAYGEGTKADEHSQAEADAHTVVHISQPGSYVVSGTLSAGQIAIDLGKDADEDPNAVVNLVLNDVDITCTVAPAVIFYNVYECGSDDSEKASADVDTSAAGANVIISDGTVNNVTGSHVARIYKPDSVELSEDGTEVLDSKKLHKYDAAFYSKRTMNIYGGAEGTGVLNILADNEGLDTELHLTINGGNINIESGNDGINTNEDGVSVTAINAGSLSILVNGSTGEGDGIDSNGWLVINGGKVVAQACATSMDSGIDSDKGIHINGGEVVTSGNMLDALEDGKVNYVVFQFRTTQPGGNSYTLKSSNGYEKTVSVDNAFSYLVIAESKLVEGEYTLWCADTQLGGAQSNNMGFGGIPGGFGGNWQGGAPEGLPEGEWPGGMPEGMPGDNWQGEMPEGMPEGEWPGGMPGQFPGMGGNASGEISDVFMISAGGNNFTNVGPVEVN